MIINKLVLRKNLKHIGNLIFTCAMVLGLLQFKYRTYFYSKKILNANFKKVSTKPFFQLARFFYLIMSNLPSECVFQNQKKISNIFHQIIKKKCFPKLKL